jgi:putative peptidoglycan lipid II flippase
LLGGSVGTAALPGLSRAVARKDHEEERRILRDTFGISLALLSPMMIFCLLLSQGIIRLVFQRGSFTPEATRLMAMVLFFYSWSLLLFAGLRILNFYLFARNESGVFLRLALMLYSLNVGFDLIYVGLFQLGAKGIPLGLLSSLTVTSGLVLRRNVCDLRSALDRTLGLFSLKVLMGALVTALVVWVLRLGVPAPVSSRGDFAYLCLLCGTGSLVFLTALVMTGALSHPWWTLLGRRAGQCESGPSSIL